MIAPVVFGAIVLTATGVGTLLAALNVSYRDVRFVIPFFVQAGMFATPTIYMSPTGEESLTIRILLAINPMNDLISAFRASILGGPIPWGGLAVAIVASVVIFFLGCLYFRKVEDRFADII